MEVETISPFDALARSNTNAAWGALAMEVLARLGVETVVSSPGSRSTPLVYAAVRNPKLEVVPVLDERAAAFFAASCELMGRRVLALAGCAIVS